MRNILFIICILFLSIDAFSESIELEPITVERDFIGNSSQDIDYFFYDQLPIFSLEEIIDYSSSIDLRKRTTFGIQQDISIRGGTFEDSSINLAGIEINDPQTGHFNLELPLTSADLEEVDVIKNSNQVNFRLRKPKAQGGLIKVSFGQHALWEELLSYNFSLGEVNNRISVEHKSSNGGKTDTDFSIYNFSSHSLWESDNREIEFLFGSTKRDFGAGNFYSASFPQEEEHITQQFYLLRAGLSGEAFDLDNTLYFRRHTDKFILNRDNPPFYTNYHTTYVYGIKSEIDLRNQLFFGSTFEKERIDSTNLAKHRRQKQGFFLGLRDKRIGEFLLNSKFSLDFTDDWGELPSANFGVAYFLEDDLKLRFSFDRIWREPSFTELYYTSPSNLGNDSLGVQESNNFEIGFDWALGDLNLSMSAFLRDQDDTIDWVKNTSGAAWQAENVGSLKSYGLDLYTKLELKDLFIDQISLGYTYLELNKENPYNFSKYVFDYNRHKLVSNFGFDLLGGNLNLIVNFMNPINRGNYTTCDLKFQKVLGDFIISLEGTNIFNKDYQELTSIDGVGRWYKLGITYNF